MVQKIFPTLGLLSLPFWLRDGEIFLTGYIPFIYTWKYIVHPLLFSSLNSFLKLQAGTLNCCLVIYWDLLSAVIVECGIAFHISRQTFRVVRIYHFVLQSTQRPKLRWRHPLYSIHSASTLVFFQGAEAV